MLLLPTAGQAATVVASIAPIHSLVQGVMGETGAAHLLVPASQSPHGAHLKPSRMKALHDAAIVFYIADEFESFLQKAFQVLPESAHRVALADEAAAAPAVDDPHIWLDPQTAARLAPIIARRLAAVSPQNRALYETNALALSARLSALDENLRHRLAAVRARPFVVFHDAYRHFTHRYGLSVAAVISQDAHDHHGALTISRIREVGAVIRRTGAVCVFHEPQFPARALHALTADLDVKSGVLDPLGAGLETGPDLYFRLLENLAAGVHRCLSA